MNRQPLKCHGVTLIPWLQLRKLATEGVLIIQKSLKHTEMLLFLKGSNNKRYCISP